MVTNGGRVRVVWLATNRQCRRVSGIAMSVLLAVSGGCKSPDDAAPKRADPDISTPRPSAPLPAPVGPEAPPPPRWQPFSQTDVMDDSAAVGVKLMADE